MSGGVAGARPGILRAAPMPIRRALARMRQAPGASTPRPSRRAHPGTANEREAVNPQTLKGLMLPEVHLLAFTPPPTHAYISPHRRHKMHPTESAPAHRA